VLKIPYGFKYIGLVKDGNLDEFCYNSHKLKMKSNLQ